jgi:hypothetical protein
VTFVRLEDDRDYHIVLVDPSDSSYPIVTEVADPSCQGPAQSPYLSLLTATRSALNALSGGRPTSLVGRTLRIRGSALYDFDHGQTGRARNCIELHPVISVEAIQ